MDNNLYVVLQRMYPTADQGSYPFRMINQLDEGDIQVNGTLDYEMGQRKFVYQVFAEVSYCHSALSKWYYFLCELKNTDSFVGFSWSSFDHIGCDQCQGW